VISVYKIGTLQSKVNGTDAVNNRCVQRKKRVRQTRSAQLGLRSEKVAPVVSASASQHLQLQRSILDTAAAGLESDAYQKKLYLTLEF